MPFAKVISELGGHATYYVLGQNADRALAGIKQVAALGHDIAYLSDTFDGFKDQPEAIQSERLDTMQKQLSDASVEVSSPAGFSAPMDAYDKTTMRLLIERQWASCVQRWCQVATRRSR